MAGPSSVVRGRRPDLDTAVVWVAGACVTSGAAAGFFVGWLYGRDESSTLNDAPWYGAAGLLVGVVLGLLVSIGSVMVLVVLDDRPWASARPTRALLAAAGAAVPILLVLEVTSGFAAHREAVAFCAAVSALPAGLATAWMDRRAQRPAASRRSSASCSG